MERMFENNNDYFNMIYKKFFENLGKLINFSFFK